MSFGTGQHSHFTDGENEVLGAETSQASDESLAEVRLELCLLSPFLSINISPVSSKSFLK